MYILAENNITKKGVKYLTKVSSSEILFSFIFIYIFNWFQPRHSALRSPHPGAHEKT